MQIIITFLTISILALIALGIWLELRPETIRNAVPTKIKGSLGIHFLIFLSGVFSILLLGFQDVLAAEVGFATEVARDIEVACTVGAKVFNGVLADAAFGECPGEMLGLHMVCKEQNGNEINDAINRA